MISRVEVDRPLALRVPAQDTRAEALQQLPADSIEAVVRGADVVVGGTTSGEVVSREPWLKRGSTFISLARRELVQPVRASSVERRISRRQSSMAFLRR